MQHRTKRYNLSFDAAQLAALSDECRRQGITRSAAVRLALHRWLDEQQAARDGRVITFIAAPRDTVEV